MPTRRIHDGDPPVGTGGKAARNGARDISHDATGIRGVEQRYIDARGDIVVPAAKRSGTERILEVHSRECVDGS